MAEPQKAATPAAAAASKPAAPKAAVPAVAAKAAAPVVAAKAGAVAVPGKTTAAPAVAGKPAAPGAAAPKLAAPAPAADAAADGATDLEAMKKKFKPKKKVALPTEMLSDAKSYDDKLILMKFLTEKEKGRVVLMVKNMLRGAVDAGKKK